MSFSIVRLSIIRIPLIFFFKFFFPTITPTVPPDCAGMLSSRDAGPWYKDGEVEPHRVPLAARPLLGRREDKLLMEPLTDCFVLKTVNL